jgi:prepilin-type N-terminal cleavage/methylation domain-containing protein
MTKQRRQSGFTAVELLITLFVAAAFLIAAYQLFNLVVKDGAATRSESRASNIAYDYLRKYAASSTTIPCTVSHPLANAMLTVDGLTSVTISVDITCPNTTTSLSKVTTSIMYNNPQQTIQYATYVSSSSAPTSYLDTTSTVATIDVSPVTKISHRLVVYSPRNSYEIL